MSGEGEDGGYDNGDVLDVPNVNDHVVGVEYVDPTPAPEQQPAPKPKPAPKPTPEPEPAPAPVEPEPA